MEHTLRSSHHPKLLVMPAILAVIYAFGTVLFVLMGLGMQTVSGLSDLKGMEWGYALLCLLGVASNGAILRGHRWGVAVQIVMWAANSALNVALHRVDALSLGVALVLVALWSIEILHSRSSLK